MELMTAALAESQLPADVESVIRTFLGGIATFLMNQGDTRG
jgi:hypothetical protein